MTNHTMSERLKETLGMLDAHQRETSEPFDDSDSEIVGTRGGAIIPFKPKEVATSIPEPEKSDIRDDYITSRNITHTLIDMAGQALEGALSVAIETQHPKAYGVFNELATTMRGLSKDLLEMQKIYKEITAEKKAKEEKEKAAQNVTNNNLNVIAPNMSLADALKMINETGNITPPGGEVIDG